MFLQRPQGKGREGAQGRGSFEEGSFSAVKKTLRIIAERNISVESKTSSGASPITDARALQLSCLRTLRLTLNCGERQLRRDDKVRAAAFFERQGKVRSRITIEDGGR
jgi:hypothetical protein